jgi:hypothetical protein
LEQQVPFYLVNEAQPTNEFLVMVITKENSACVVQYVSTVAAQTMNKLHPVLKGSSKNLDVPVARMESGAPPLSKKIEHLTPPICAHQQCG